MTRESQLRGAELLRATPSLNALFARDGGLLLQSEAARSQFGASTFVARFVDEAVGRALLQRAAEQDFSGEHELQTSAGVLRHSLSVRGARDPISGAPAFVVEYRELTQTSFALMFESPDAQLLVDHELRIRDCNQSAVQLLGVASKEDVLGTLVLALCPERQPSGRLSGDAVWELQAQIARDGAGRFEWEFLRRDGKAFSAEVVISKVRVNGETMSFTSVRDATERNREQALILRSREEALNALRLKSQFLANMSHEIRTPMHGVLGMLSLALSTELSPEQLDFIGNARASAENLLEIINDILDLSKLEAGRLSIENRDLELEPLLRAALQTTALRAHAKGIELTVEVRANTPAVFAGDAVRLRQILINLLGNAVKFTEIGNVLLSTGLVERDGQRWLRFAVSDTGMGISPAQQRQVFEAFEQADASATRRHGGTGLGLTISKELVERMGGGFELTSVEGQGSTFAFTIPLLEAAAPVSVQRPALDLAGRQVMVVHVNGLARRVLADALRARGAQVLMAHGAEHALELAREQPALHAVFIDHRMDDAHDALELPALLRKHPSCLDTRFVLLRTERIGRAALSTAGYAYALDKPALPSDIDSALSDSLSQSLPTGQFMLVPERLAKKRSHGPLEILVVEDHPVNAHFLVSLLTRWGHRVVHAWNGQNALLAHDQTRFDLLLMDVQMPVLDGLETTRRIRQRELGSRTHVPILALTASGMKSDEDECFAAGMDYFLCKPIDVEMLDRLLSRLSNLRPQVSARPAPKPQQRALEAPPFSREALLARACGDPRFQADLVQVFMSSLDEMMRDLEQAVAAADAHLTRHAAHRLKGGLMLVCAEPAAELALALEKAAREGKTDDFVALLHGLRRETARLRAAFGDLHSSNAN